VIKRGQELLGAVVNRSSLAPTNGLVNFSLAFLPFGGPKPGLVGIDCTEKYPLVRDLKENLLADAELCGCANLWGESYTDPS